MGDKYRKKKLRQGRWNKWNKQFKTHLTRVPEEIEK